jgi:hypothetical protein
MAWEVLTEAASWIDYSPIEAAIDRMRPLWW